ncbi:hypothetical protein WOLCODRAFT_156767 [Wolfiporia cocos MD-104 SS10]|uniref:Uncharacterized protein n=1 Tax=Wolfiporia cocos (strain MD-104) TaxID=742152 RepID=A0A2H3JH63_WOLCO|nr:hypothetical protein WOLCODRAFT_156767 [Wolfiporia cocos MD-104 SS10]
MSRGVKSRRPMPRPAYKNATLNKERPRKRVRTTYEDEQDIATTSRRAPESRRASVVPSTKKGRRTQSQHVADVEHRERKNTEEDEDGSKDEQVFKNLIVQMRLLNENPSRDENESHLKIYKLAGRYILRCINPFMKVDRVIALGIRLYGVPGGEWGANDLPNGVSMEDARQDLGYYEELLGICPVLHKQIRYLEGKEKALIHLAQYLDQHSRYAQSDNCTKIKNNCLKYLPDLRRVLRIYRDEFDEDPEAFCRAMRAGEIEVDAGDLPSFLYPENGYDEEKPEQNLLMLPILVTNFRCLFKGPSAAQSFSVTDAKKGGGRPPLCKIYSLDEVTPEQIAYTALITCFGYASRNVWDDNDGTFLGAEFYTYILNVFKADADWAARTLAWFNKEVYGKGTQTVAPNGVKIRKHEGPSLIERINKWLAEASEAASHPESDDLPIPLRRKSPLGLFESFNDDEDEEAVVAQVDGEEQVEEQVDGKEQVEEQVDGEEQVEEQVDSEEQVEEQVDGEEQVEEQVDGEEQVEEQVDGEEQVEEQVDGEEQVEEQVDSEQGESVDELMEEDGEEEAGDDEAEAEDEDGEEDGEEEDD